MSRRDTLRRVGLLVLGVNLVLALLKGAVWLTSGSLAVQGEAVNSAADTAYSLVVVAGLYLTTQPPDFEHPHGHERIEPFVSLFVALGIFAAGAAVLWQAGQSLLSGTVTVTHGPAAAAVLIASGVVDPAAFDGTEPSGFSLEVFAAAKTHAKPRWNLIITTI